MKTGKYQVFIETRTGSVTKLSSKPVSVCEDAKRYDVFLAQYVEITVKEKGITRSHYIRERSIVKVNVPFSFD